MLKCYVQMEKFGGKRNWRSRKYLSRSFVKAFLNGFYNFCQAASNTTLNTSNSSAAQRAGGTVNGWFNIFYVNVGGGGGKAMFCFDTNGGGSTPSTAEDCEDVGIVVGTGSTAVTPTDYALETKVAHGTSSSQLQHFGHLVSEVTVSAPNASFDIERIFRNSSGGSIIINEIGLQASSHAFGTTGFNFLLIRDVISPTVTVANGEYLKVKYTIQVTV